MTPLLEAATAKVRATADALARAYNHEHELEDLRAAIKADAIKRVMVRDSLAATPAEKIVETDSEYFAHRERQSASVVERFKADAEYWAAKCEATQASLITPEMIVLQAENADLSLHVDEIIEANRSLLRARNDALTVADDLRHRLDGALGDVQSLGIEVADLTNQLRDAKARWENMKMGVM